MPERSDKTPFTSGDRVRVTEDILGLKDRRGVIRAVGRVHARVAIDGQRGDRPIPLAVLEPEPRKRKKREEEDGS
jgi:hypothetical protein